MDTSAQEVWKPVVGQEGRYEVSSIGRVRSIDHAVVGRDGRRQFRTGRILRASPDGHGYPRVWFGKKARNVHRLLAEAFLPNPEGYPHVLHWDDDPANLALTNLRWGTHAQNMRDIVRNGNHWESSKTECPRGHALVMPNLTSHEWSRGIRKCRACTRAQKQATRQHLSLTQEMADAHFAKIMAEASQ